MTQIVSVATCTRRRDDKWMVTFKDARGTGYAVSDHHVEEGTDVRVRDGRVIG